MGLFRSKLLDHPLQFILPLRITSIRKRLCESVLSWPESDDRRKKLAKKPSAESAFKRSWMLWDLRRRRRQRRRSLQTSPTMFRVLHIFNSERAPKPRTNPPYKCKLMATTRLLNSSHKIPEAK
jgi:hypothetical protein